jgi:hypothetical protein
MSWYHYSSKNSLKLDNLYDLDYEDHISYPFKPSGLWLTLEEEWFKFQNEIGDDNFIKKLKYRYEVELKDYKELNILIIQNDEDLKIFDYKYKDTSKDIEFHYDSYGPTFPDWKKVCQDYDGMICLNYQDILSSTYITPEKYKMRKHWWFWLDINSVCIWRPSKILKEIKLL